MESAGTVWRLWQLSDTWKVIRAAERGEKRLVQTHKKVEFGCSHHCPSKADIQGLVYRGQIEDQNKIISSLSSAVAPGAMDQPDTEQPIQLESSCRFPLDCQSAKVHSRGGDMSIRRQLIKWQPGRQAGQPERQSGWYVSYFTRYSLIYCFIVSVAPIQPYRPPNRITGPTSTWMTVTTTTIEMILFFKATK